MPELHADARAEAVVDALGLLYHDDLDPEEFMLFPEGETPTIEADGEVSDWADTYGGRPAFECLVRTILSQNTSDAASQPAHDALMERYADRGSSSDVDATGLRSPHEAVREALERDVPPEKCGFGHTAMIQFGREYCTARSPACLDDPEACPLAGVCDQVGVVPERGEAIDPAEAGASSDAGTGTDGESGSGEAGAGR